MDLKQVTDRLGNNGLDYIEGKRFGSEHLVGVVFKVEPDTTRGALLLHLDLNERTFSVGSSSTTSARSFHPMAAAYQRASAFLLDLGFKAE